MSYPCSFCGQRHATYEKDDLDCEWNSPEGFKRLKRRAAHVNGIVGSLLNRIEGKYSLPEDSKPSPAEIHSALRQMSNLLEYRGVDVVEWKKYSKYGWYGAGTIGTLVSDEAKAPKPKPRRKR